MATEPPNGLVTFSPGDVLRYVGEIHHCREWMAYVDERGRAIDTFWSTRGDGESHVLTESELASAEVLFNVAGFDELDRYSSASRGKWETYHPDDRVRITSQHGLQEVLFVRRGAQPDLGTQIANARQRVAGAESDLRVAEMRLENARRDLVELERSAA